MSAGETQDPATGTLIVATAIMVAAVITVVMILAATTADMVTVAVMLITEGYRGKCKRSRCHEPDTGYDCPLPHPVTSSSV
ncbi:MAG: hypothetical protein M1340_00700 [Actinobacteria bacterium]|nr:hypothetical protein [Actinomycetota bacterium]MCL6092346.1 hypothetical protein [Actinomycetota bacterium]